MGYRYQKRSSDSPYFHIYNRGLDKMSIFKSGFDYQRFIDRMFEYINEVDADLICYCLMKNHFHLILRENKLGEIARFIQKLCTSYAMYFNLKNKRTGYVFQGPYKEKNIDSDEYLLQLSAYIHNNPIELGINPEQYKWSSYLDYLSGLDSNLVKSPILGYFSENNKVAAYQEFVSSHLNQGQAFNLESRPGLGLGIEVA